MKERCKRKIKFYGKLTSMSERRLTKKLYNYITELKDTTKWIEKTRKDIVEG